MLRRLVIMAALLALLAGVAIAAWQACGMPPLRLVLEYGYPSPMGPTGRTITIEGVEFVEISPGYFRMGSHFLCDQGDLLGRICAPLGLAWGRQPVHGDPHPARTGWQECPLVWVEFEDGIWAARTELTITQWERFAPAPNRARNATSGQVPVSRVSWTDAQLYCEWLSRRTRHRISLPSEAEWECACRAGSSTEYNFGDDPEELGQHAWFDENTPDIGIREIHVATMPPSAWGLYGFHGTVREWCADTMHLSHDGAPWDGTPRREPGEESHGMQTRIVRGGSFGLPAIHCRAATRGCLYASEKGWTTGFRPFLQWTPSRTSTR